MHCILAFYDRLACETKPSNAKLSPLLVLSSLHSLPLVVPADMLGEEEEGEQPMGAAAMINDQKDTEQEEQGENPDEQEKPTLREILKAVNKCTALVDTFKSYLRSLSEDVAVIRHDLQEIRERTTATESRISDLEDKLPSLMRDSQTTKQLAGVNSSRAEDPENHVRRNNVRIIGLPQKMEGRDPTEFIEHWLLDIFGKDAFTPHFSVERAHRTPTRPLPPGNPPRPMLAHLLNYSDKETILRITRECRNIQYNGARVSFYPDFSASGYLRHVVSSQTPHYCQWTSTFL